MKLQDELLIIPPEKQKGVGSKKVRSIAQFLICLQWKQTDVNNAKSNIS